MGMVAKDLGLCMPPISKVCEDRSCEGDTRGSQALPRCRNLGVPAKGALLPLHSHPSVDPPTPLQLQAMSVTSLQYLFPREKYNCPPPRRQAPSVALSSAD